MSIVKNTALKCLAKVSKKHVEMAPHTMCSYLSFEPKMPQQLIKKS